MFLWCFFSVFFGGVFSFFKCSLFKCLLFKCLLKCFGLLLLFFGGLGGKGLFTCLFFGWFGVSLVCLFGFVGGLFFFVFSSFFFFPKVVFWTFVLCSKTPSKTHLWRGVSQWSCYNFVCLF